MATEHWLQPVFGKTADEPHWPEAWRIRDVAAERIWVLDDRDLRFSSEAAAAVAIDCMIKNGVRDMHSMEALDNSQMDQLANLWISQHVVIRLSDLMPRGPEEGTVDENYPHCMVSSNAYRQMARAWLLFKSSVAEISINPDLRSNYAGYVLAAVLSGARSEWSAATRDLLQVIPRNEWLISLKSKLDNHFPDSPKYWSDYLDVTLPPSWYPWWATYRAAYPRLRSGTLEAIAAAGVLHCVDHESYFPTPDQWRQLCRVLPLEPIAVKQPTVPFVPPVRYRRHLY